MNTLSPREISGRGLAVLDHIDIQELAITDVSGFPSVGFLLLSPAYRRAFIGFVSRHVTDVTGKISGGGFLRGD